MSKNEHTDRGDKEREQDALRQTASDLQRIAPLLTASWQLVAAVLLPTLLGWWLDKKFETTPWIMLAAAAFGITVGLFGFIRTALSLGKTQKKSQNQKRRPPHT